MGVCFMISFIRNFRVGKINYYMKIIRIIIVCVYGDWLGRGMVEFFWSDGNFLVVLIIGVCIF